MAALPILYCTVVRDDCVYHYTTASGFLGIISSQSLRATDFSFLNDSSEIEYGVNLITAMAQKLPAVPRDHSQWDNRSDLLRAINAFRTLNELYVTCFTSLRDDLSQWRGYGGADADRYCIGFRRSSLNVLSAPEHAYTSIRVVDLLYDPSEQQRRIQAVLAHHEQYKFLTQDTIQQLSEIALMCKNPSFAAEREVRVAISILLNTASDVVEFAVTRGRIKPYISVAMERSARLPIEEVIVLPAGVPQQRSKQPILSLHVTVTQL